MEFIMDISIIVVTLIFATTILAYYGFSLTFSYFKQDRTDAFAVIDVIRLLKKACPLSIGNKWRLLPLCSGLSRCWTKKIQFPGFQNSVSLCGSTSAISCSSMYAFSLIADVSNWGEWEYLPSSKNLLLKPFSSKMHKDSYMQADQVVGIQRGTNVQSYIAMYRFMSFSEKTVKWIFFWNAKTLEFMFFLIQPAVSKTVESKCVITHIYGSKYLSPHMAPFVVQRLRNIKDFLLLSQLHVVSSKYVPATPIISTSHVHKPQNPADVKSQSNATSSNPTGGDIHLTFMLVPIYHLLKPLYNKVKGFRLVVKKVDADPASKESGNSEGKSAIQRKKSPKLNAPVAPKDKLKRSSSDICVKPRKVTDFGSNLELNSKKNDSIIQGSLTEASSIIVEESVNIDYSQAKGDSEGVNISRQQRSLSMPGISHADKQKATHSDYSDIQSDEETYVNLHIIHENVSQENESMRSQYDKNELFCSSTSEFEQIDSNQQFLACTLAGFLTQGNYGASELQAEMMLASDFDKILNSEESASGGWMYHSNYKGITVLSKVTAGQFMKITSFISQIELPVAAKDVWNCVKNPRFRFFCDETVKIVKIVERISESQRLIHVYHEIGGFLKKECIDFCLLQTEREEGNHYYSSFHSIEFEKCPFMTSVVRGSLRPSGWVVEKLGSKSCRVTHLMQILVNSPDNLYIQELSSLVPLAMHNLKNYTASEPK